jgi:hypothetical protein
MYTLAPINVITLDQTITTDIQQMITIREYLTYIKQDIDSYFELAQSGQFDRIYGMITLTLITLSGAHCKATTLNVL